MHRMAHLTSTILLLAISAPLCAKTTWPDGYCFCGRWDLRTTNRAITVNSGSYVQARFTGGSLAASFDVSVNQPPMPTIAWRIDNGQWREAEVASTVNLAHGLAKGPHTVMLMARGIDEHQNRWTRPLVASITFTGFTLPKDGRLEKALPQWKKPALKMEFLGDSITEGVLVQEGRAGVIAGMPKTWPWLTDARMSYAGQTAMMLGAAWRQVGFGATGLVRIGSGGAPGALTTFNLFHADCPRDAWQPDVVIVNQGTNEMPMKADEYQPLYVKYLEMIRAGYPKAKIVALRPFCGAQETSIKAAVGIRNAAGDAKVYYIDTTGWYDGPIHPNAAASTELAKKLVDALKADVLAAKGR